MREQEEGGEEMGASGRAERRRSGETPTRGDRGGVVRSGNCGASRGDERNGREKKRQGGLGDVSNHVGLLPSPDRACRVDWISGDFDRGGGPRQGRWILLPGLQVCNSNAAVFFLL